MDVSEGRAIGHNQKSECESHFASSKSIHFGSTRTRVHSERVNKKREREDFFDLYCRGFCVYCFLVLLKAHTNGTFHSHIA